MSVPTLNVSVAFASGCIARAVTSQPLATTKKIMRLPSNIRAVFTALVDVMTHQHEGRVRIADIVARTGVATTTVEQSFSTLRKAHILNVSRGPGGGFLLMSSPEEVSMFEVVHALDPNFATRPIACPQDDSNSNLETIWRLYHEYNVDFLQQMSLADFLLDSQRQSTAKTLRKASGAVRPLPAAVRRGVPNSVFDLANAMRA